MERIGHRNIRFAAADGSFRFLHFRDEKPDPRGYTPHYENGYEIYMFISGNGSYTIEGSRYELEPYSILLLNSNELHVVNISEGQPYERIVLMLNHHVLPPFMTNGVDFFRAIKLRKPGQDNLIQADTVRGSGLPELFDKLRQLFLQQSAESEFVAKCIIVQMLWTINRIAEKIEQTGPGIKVNPKIGEVLAFINENLQQSLELEALSQRFFINKHHLCRTFKESTGFSIHQYITYKRIRLADELMLSGHPPTQACFMSGFNSYSNFFRSYRKLTGRSPKDAKSR